VQHRLDSDEARRCGNGHFVAPTIARAELVKSRPPAPPAPSVTGPAPAPKVVRYRNMSAKAQRRHAVKAHNRRVRSKAIKQQMAGEYLNQGD
jgi:hypothetical protein